MFRVRHDDRALEELEFDPRCPTKWPQEIVKAFRRRMQQLRSLNDERDLYQNRGMNFEALKGARKGDFSVRLNAQWRLILRFEDAAEKTMVIRAIEDYH